MPADESVEKVEVAGQGAYPICVSFHWPHLDLSLHRFIVVVGQRTSFYWGAGQKLGGSRLSRRGSDSSTDRNKTDLLAVVDSNKALAIITF